MQGKDAIGTSKRKEGPKAHELRSLDLAQPGSINQLRLNDIDYAVLLAGVTNISYCHEHPKETWRINVLGSGAIVERLRHNNIPCMLVSTTCVFHEQAASLSETAIRVPSCVYGQQKKELEDLVALCEQNLTVRITKAWGSSTCLATKWYQSLQVGTCIEAFYDLEVAPLHLDSACRFLAQAITNSYKGVIHLSPEAQTSYYEVARRLCLSTGLNPDQFVVPVSCKDHPRVIYRPNRAALDCEGPHSLRLNLNEELSSIVSDAIGCNQRGALKPTL